jgi:hypothetical protein
MTKSRLNIGRIARIAVGLVSLTAAALFLESTPCYSPSVRVKKGKLDSGTEYIVRSSHENLTISFPGARIVTYPISLREEEFGIDCLQDEVKTADGKDISRDEVFYTRVIMHDGENDGNQPPRDYWRANSIPNTSLRGKVIAMGNEVARKENLHRAFRDGSPDLTTAYRRGHRTENKSSGTGK